QPVNNAGEAIQVSNLLYRRFPIGSASEVRERVWIRGVRRLEVLHTAGWETCATTLSTALLDAEVSLERSCPCS
ncbi:MAG: hypothetical protein AAB466_00610, partial [Verrucomicrobiota bacterium]